MAIVENGCSGSTTFVWKKVKITPAASPQGTARAKRAPLKTTARRKSSGAADLRSPKTVQVKARGGGELWWELTWGGVTKRFPGHVTLQDALLCLLTHDNGCKVHHERRVGNFD